jgi:hypothetical protein
MRKSALSRERTLTPTARLHDKVEEARDWARDFDRQARAIESTRKARVKR